MFEENLNLIERDINTVPIEEMTPIEKLLVFGVCLLPESTVATLLDVKPSTLRNWRHKSCGPSWVKYEGLVRYPLEELIMFIQTQSN